MASLTNVFKVKVKFNVIKASDAMRKISVIPSLNVVA